MRCVAPCVLYLDLNAQAKRDGVEQRLLSSVPYVYLNICVQHSWSNEERKRERVFHHPKNRFIASSLKCLSSVVFSYLLTCTIWFSSLFSLACTLQMQHEWMKSRKLLYFMWILNSSALPWWNFNGIPICVLFCVRSRLHDKINRVHFFSFFHASINLFQELRGNQKINAASLMRFFVVVCFGINLEIKKRQ